MMTCGFFFFPSLEKTIQKTNESQLAVFAAENAFFSQPRMMHYCENHISQVPHNIQWWQSLCFCGHIVGGILLQTVRNLVAERHKVILMPAVGCQFHQQKHHGTAFSLLFSHLPRMEVAPELASFHLLNER